MPAKIFLNYRRTDAGAQARNLHDRLGRSFGAANVFMDVDHLRAGQRFDKELEKALGACGVLLAVMGPRWAEVLAERKATGERDFVCDEIAAAIKRDVMVVPVLVDGAHLPRAEEMPEAIRELVLHQAHRLTHERFGRDVDDLIAAIAEGDNGVRLVRSRRASGLAWASAAALVAVAAGGAVWQWPEVARLVGGFAATPQQTPKAQQQTEVVPVPSAAAHPRPEPEKKAIEQQAAATTAAPAPSKSPPPVQRRFLLTGADVVEKVAPAAVSISVQKKPRTGTVAGKSASSDGAAGTRDSLSRLPEDLPEFFRKFQPEPVQARTQHGSGVIVSAAGHIVTVDYVMEEAERITVTLADGARYEAELIGVDSVHQLAVLRLKTNAKMPFLEFADRLPGAGEQVVMIGNALGKEGSVRLVKIAGFDSKAATFEGLDLSGPLVNGESGAPLIGLDGEVIGIARANWGGAKELTSHGIGVPGHIVRVVVDQILSNGRITDWGAISVQAERTRQIVRPIDNRLPEGVPASLSALVQNVVVSVTGQVDSKEAGKVPATLPAVLGTIISSSGHVVISNSAIEKLRNPRITTRDGGTFDADIVGRDPRTDIALLLIKSSRSFPFLNFAAASPRVGDIALGIGGSTPSKVVVRNGLVAALGREGLAAGPYDLIQTVLGMEKGETGPILSYDGRIIGISSHVQESQVGGPALAFAVPASVAGIIVEQLKSTGRVDRGWLGVKIMNIDADMAKSLSLPDTSGAVLTEVTAKGPAETHGLKAEDIILSVNGARITDTRHLARTIAEHAPESLIDVRIKRKGEAKEQTIKVRLGKFSTQTETAPAKAEAETPPAPLPEKAAPAAKKGRGSQGK